MCRNRHPWNSSTNRPTKAVPFSVQPSRGQGPFLRARRSLRLDGSALAVGRARPEKLMAYVLERSCTPCHAAFSSGRPQTHRVSTCYIYSTTPCVFLHALCKDRERERERERGKIRSFSNATRATAALWTDHPHTYTHVHEETTRGHVCGYRNVGRKGATWGTRTAAPKREKKEEVEEDTATATGGSGDEVFRGRERGTRGGRWTKGGGGRGEG